MSQSFVVNFRYHCGVCFIPEERLFHNINRSVLYLKDIAGFPPDPFQTLVRHIPRPFIATASALHGSGGFFNATDFPVEFFPQYEPAAVKLLRFVRRKPMIIHCYCLFQIFILLWNIFVYLFNTWVRTRTCVKVNNFPEFDYGFK